MGVRALRLGSPGAGLASTGRAAGGGLRVYFQVFRRRLRNVRSAPGQDRGAGRRRQRPFFIAALSPTGQTRRGQRRQQLPFPPPPSTRRQRSSTAALTTPCPPPTPFLHPDAPWASLRAGTPPSPEPAPLAQERACGAPSRFNEHMARRARPGRRGPGGGLGTEVLPSRDALDPLAR